MNALHLDLLLHQALQYYKGRVGETLRVALPRIPLTRSTQYYRLKREIQGKGFVEEPSRDESDGYLSPTMIRGKIMRPGPSRIRVKVVDAFSEEDIPGVEPLDIIIEGEDSK